MAIASVSDMSDRELLDNAVRAAADERNSIVRLLTFLSEIEVRKLHLSEGCPSLFIYCTRILRFSEHEAYHRIEAARTMREYPEIAERLREGALTLTAVTLLRPHLNRHNADALVTAALYKTRREIELQMARLASKSDAEPIVRRLPAVARAAVPRAPLVDMSAAVDVPTSRLPPPAPRPFSRPLSSDRYLLRVTLSAGAHARLQRARDLLRHSIPSGDPGEIVERALTLLVEDLERQRIGSLRGRRERKAVSPPSVHSRYIPARIRREVWTRDEGRCAFVGRGGRCRETGFLEFHHVKAFALGGRTSTENLELRCRAHNQYEGALLFGAVQAASGVDASLGLDATRPGPS